MKTQNIKAWAVTYNGDIVELCRTRQDAREVKQCRREGCKIAKLTLDKFVR